MEYDIANIIIDISLRVAQFTEFKKKNKVQPCLDNREVDGISF